MIPPATDPKFRAYEAWALQKGTVDSFSGFMAGWSAGHKEGFAAGCENCLGIEPAPRVPTIDDLRAQLAAGNPWKPYSLRELFRGRR